MTAGFGLNEVVEKMLHAIVTHMLLRGVHEMLL